MTTTLNPATSVHLTLSNGNLTATADGSGDNGLATSTTAYAQSSGELRYAEFSGIANFSSGSNGGLGVANPSVVSTGAAGEAYYVNISGSPLLGSADGQTIGVAIDLINNKVWFRYISDGLWNGTTTAFQNPETNTGGFDLTVIPGDIAPFMFFVTTGQIATINYGALPFAGVLPAGYIAWDGTRPPNTKRSFATVMS